MRRRLLLLVAVFVAAGTLVLLASPARAVPANVCAGTGKLFTGPLVHLVTISLAVPPSAVTVTQPRTVGFALTLFTGTCAPDLTKVFTATGTLNGWCGLVSGAGATANGQRFAFVGIGTALVFTGEVTGMMTWTANATKGENCNHGALSFTVATIPVVAKGPCGGPKAKTATTIPIPATLTSVFVPPGFVVGFHTGPVTVHSKVCA